MFTVLLSGYFQSVFSHLALMLAGLVHRYFTLYTIVSIPFYSQTCVLSHWFTIHKWWTLIPAQSFNSTPCLMTNTSRNFQYKHDRQGTEFLEVVRRRWKCGDFEKHVASLPPQLSLCGNILYLYMKTNNVITNTAPGKSKMTVIISFDALSFC